MLSPRRTAMVPGASHQKYPTTTTTNLEPLVSAFPQHDNRPFLDLNLYPIIDLDPDDEDINLSPSPIVDLTLISDDSDPDPDHYAKLKEEDKLKRDELRRKLAHDRSMRFTQMELVFGQIFPVMGEPEGNEEDEGPFAEALKIVEQRGGAVKWLPKRNRESWFAARSAPSLKDLCLRVLEVNEEVVESLEGLPDLMKETLVAAWCRKRRMNKRILGLCLVGDPVEVRLRDSSLLTEQDFLEVFDGYINSKLKVLQLDFCGRFMSDFVLQATLVPLSRYCSLTTISLKGAYSLSDDGLCALVNVSKSVESVNLRQCSFLTSDGIIKLTKKLIALRELYLDDCQGVDAMVILTELCKLVFLEALSVARLKNVNDTFVFTLVRECGYRLKELVLADCRNLTTASMRAIGENCPQLRTLDIQNLNQLKDFALRHLANGWGTIEKLKLRHNMFRDEAVAAFLEASGKSLTELSLHSVREVAGHTALAISLRCSKTLQCLDLSFCRNISDEALGLIVDSCSKLRNLILIGCTQITDYFLNGHSNPQLNIIGLNGPIIDEIKAPEFM